MFETTGSPEQIENVMKKYLNFCKTLTKLWKHLDLSTEREKVSSAFRETIRGGPILWLKPTIHIFSEIEVWGAILFTKCLFATFLLLAHLLGNLSIFNYQHNPFTWSLFCFSKTYSILFFSNSMSLAELDKISFPIWKKLLKLRTFVHRNIVLKCRSFDLVVYGEVYLFFLT